MDEELQENEGTLGQFFRTVFSQKWVALIVLVVVTAVGTLGLHLGYNRSSTQYVASFRLNLPNSNELQSDYTYPDGKTLFYGELIGKSTLEEVKQSNPDYGKVDIDGLVNNNAITIKEDISTTSVGSQRVVNRVYTLYAKAKYFPDIDTARAFLSDLASHPRQYLLTMNIEYFGYLKLYQKASNYELQIEHLTKQLAFVQQKYVDLIDNYGTDFVVQNAIALKDYLAEVNAYADSHAVTTLKAQLMNNGHPYVKSETDKTTYRYELEITEKQWEDAKTVLSAMEGKSDSAESLRDQAQKVADLGRRVDALKSFISENSIVDSDGTFAAVLDNVYNEVQTLTEQLKNATDTVYKNASAVYFTNANAITSTGSISIVISLGGSFVVGLILACIVAYVVAKVRKPKQPAEKKGQAPQQEE